MNPYLRTVWILSSLIGETITVLLLWRWFITPLGVPMIVFPQAVGINLLLTVLLWRMMPAQLEPSAVHRQMLTWMAALLIGWLFSYWM